MAAVENTFRDGRILITGVSGWLGRELVATLCDRNPDAQILGVGRTEGEVIVNGRAVEVVNWESTAINEWRPEIICHLAFLTREFLGLVGETRFIEINSSLSQKALSLLEADSVRSAFLVSSGAAIQPKLDVYGELKRNDELAFKAKAGKIGKSLTIARAWSLSGSHCIKPQNFLLYSLISQALNDDNEIRIKSSIPVWRRYVDAGEFFQSAMSCTPDVGSVELNSSGELIEAGDLARVIQETLGTSKEMTRPDVDWQDKGGNYFTEDLTMQSVMSSQGIRYSDLADQIKRSASAVTRDAAGIHASNNGLESE